HLKKSGNHRFCITVQQADDNSDNYQEQDEGKNLFVQGVIGIRKKTDFDSRGIVSGEPMLDSHFP
ncbi:hypothetical protein IJ556_01825, partial [bacterium]|nr:hypothetical protein [bacterium]